MLCGNGSVVERHLAKVNVAGSNLVSRSKYSFRTIFLRRYSQVVRPRSAKPSCPGSNPGGASRNVKRLSFQPRRFNFNNFCTALRLNIGGRREVYLSFHCMSAGIKLNMFGLPVNFANTDHKKFSAAFALKMRQHSRPRALKAVVLQNEGKKNN